MILREFFNLDLNAWEQEVVAMLTLLGLETVPQLIDQASHTHISNALHVLATFPVQWRRELSWEIIRSCSP